MDPDESALRAKRAIEAGGYGEWDHVTSLHDLLADLMHLAFLEGIEFETVLTQARQSYGQEHPKQAWSPKKKRR